MPTLDLDGLELYFERKGEGPPLLFISGTGSDLRNRPNVLDGPVPGHFDARLLALSALDPFGDEPGYAEGRRLQLEARAQHDTWERLPRIACPTLICAGRRDGIATPEAQEKMAARIPGAELRFFEGGHLFLLQDRQAFPAMIAFMQAGS